MKTATPMAMARAMAAMAINVGLLPSPLDWGGVSVIFVIIVKNMISYIREGQVKTIYPSMTSGDDEVTFIVEEGEEEAMSAYGMHYPLNQGYSPVITMTNTVSQVIHDNRYRAGLVSYIGRYVTVPEVAIYRAIPTGAYDHVVAQSLSKLPRVRSTSSRAEGRVHMIANILSKAAHVKVDEYLDYGTGRGDVALAIGKMLEANVTGVEVYHDKDRVIDTQVIRQGELLPREWEGRFQLITAFSVLHHVHDQEATIKELCRVLAPGGLLVIREHDYVDESIVWSDDGMKVLEPKDRPFRVFLDAIHVVAMATSSTGSIEPDFWALYRAKREWDAMVMSNRGMVASYTSYINNPQRLYTQVYMKYPGEGVPLILENRTRRSDRIRDFFPRRMIDGVLGPMPNVIEGINYNEEVLAYMTPWSDARSTSMAIHQKIKDRHPRYRLVDGTGGAGGNAIAFSQNRSITHLTIYERVPLFHGFIVNNVGLYVDNAPRTGGNTTTYKNGHQWINIIEGELPMDRIDLRGTVLFLDVPWIHEGTSYLLEGYMYGGMTLEDVARMAKSKGAIMIVFKLPPGYRLGLRNDRHSMGKEDLLFVTHVDRRQSDGPQIRGGDPAKEMIRINIMKDIKANFDRLFPQANFYRWLNERMIHGILDPIIPATDEYVPSAYLASEQVDMPRDYAGLYRMAMSMGIPRRDIPMRDPVALRQMLMDRVEPDDSKMRELDDIVRQSYLTFSSHRNVGRAKITIDNRRGVATLKLEPDQTLQRLVTGTMTFTITRENEAALKMKHKGEARTFLPDMTSMIMRYSMIEPITPSPHLQVDYEALGSPLTSTIDKYYSLFPDTDKVFGSLGSFYRSSPTEGRWLVDTPYIDDVIPVIERMMQEAASSGNTVTMIVISQSPSNRLTTSPYTREVNPDGSFVLRSI